MELKDLGNRVSQTRGNMGIRAAAAEIGVSPTTLSKVERGHIPDMKTLEKICTWIGESPDRFTAVGGLQIAFKKDQAVPKTTAKSLANAIQIAYEQFEKLEVKGH
jgi:transcriptional regulator with XRE-family HTH domain